MKKSVLVVTVGGSHEPILAAIVHANAEFVVFVCSNDDRLSGTKGSYSQIEGKGKIIKAARSDDKPTLGNIPSIAGLRADSFRVVVVDADELQESYRTIAILLDELAIEFREVICDYTGGTKSMTAALVMAAVQNDKVQLQVVAGTRTNLERVQTANQFVETAWVGRARFMNQMRYALGFWKSYEYSSSLSHLEMMRPVNADDKDAHRRALTACRAFVAWDVFDHHDAKSRLSLISQNISTVSYTHLTLPTNREV